MRYYIIAGEASGDLHASNLIAAIMKKDPQAIIRGWGGDLMAAKGADIVKHYRDLAFMGFAEVLMNLRTILRNLSFCKKDILAFQPDVLVLVDYPGFNLRMASFAHQHNIRVAYYISPQIWAWKRNRVFTIRKVVDRMLVILPFEKAFYKQFEVEVDFVGHPLLDALEQSKPQQDNWIREQGLDDRPIVALLPGSRKQEIKRMLLVMRSMANRFKDFQFVIAGAPSVDAAVYHELTKGYDIQLVTNQTYTLLKHAAAALVTSGTATLETALLGVPEVVCYKGNKISYLIAKQLVKIKYISLVNLIMDREVVKELIQDELNEKRLEEELRNIVVEKERVRLIKQDYQELREKLGGAGASANAAAIVCELAFAGISE